MNSKEYLNQAKKLFLLVKNKQAEAELFREMACMITAPMDGERVRSSGKSRNLETSVIAAADLETEAEKLQRVYSAKLKDIITVIEKVKSPTEYDVLHKRYVQGMPLKDIADAYGRDYTWATTVHGRALQSVQDILDQEGRGNAE